MTDTPARSRWQLVKTDAPPPTAVWITMRVESILSHYFQPNISEAVDLLSAATWIDVLRDIPKEAIDQAFFEWVRNEERRPTPAGIRKRALARVVGPLPTITDNATFPPVVVDAAELERRREMQARLLGEFPMLKRMEGEL